MSELTIKNVMDEILLPHGFEGKPRGLPIYTRNVQGSIQELGVRKGKTADRSYAVIFNVPEEDTFYELSPICPLKNTYWWPERLSMELARSLRNQISNIALPYFNRALDDKVISHAKNIIKETFENLCNDSPPFVSFEDGFWRTRGDFIDIVDVEVLVNYCFAYVYVTCWHKSFLDENECLTPENTTRVASHTVGNNKLDLEANSTLFFLGQSHKGTNALNKTICSVVTSYFNQISTVNNVVEQIRQEYKHHYA